MIDIGIIKVTRMGGEPVDDQVITGRARVTALLAFMAGRDRDHDFWVPSDGGFSMIESPADVNWKGMW